MIGKSLLILAFCCFAVSVQAARGIGATSGVGTTDSIETASLSWPSKFSFSGWYFANTLTGNTGPRLWDAIGTGFSTQTLFSTTGTILNFQTAFSTTGGSWTVAAPSTGVWHNLVVTYDGTSTANTPTIYVDGVSQSVTTATAPVGTVSTGAANIYLGNTNLGTRNFDGSLAEFAFWTGQILSANEATALNRGASPLKIRASSLLVYLPLYGQLTNEPDWGPSHLAETIIGTKFHPHAPSQPYPQIVYGQ
jgi:hypothetical protein